MNIQKEQVIGIGDNFNDIEMIQNSGIGVSMENSADEIKNVSDYVTTDNNNDGVGKYINDNILNK